ncbi:MAG: BrnT family toxin [Roseiarcus sp.]
MKSERKSHAYQRLTQHSILQGLPHKVEGSLDELRYKRIGCGMEFAWDEDKHHRNLRERGFGFDFAALIFAGPVIEKRDHRKEYGELRILALGEVEGIVLAVIYTDREDVRRIISARRASKKERAEWQLFARP